MTASRFGVDFRLQELPNPTHSLAGDAASANLRIAGEAILVLMGDMKKIVLIVAGLVGFGIGEARTENQIDFARDIQPILQKSCVECHGPEKPKGKLRLDSKAAAFKGGKDGEVIVAGKADQSEFYRRITLPADNDDVMPNKGDRLTKAQTDLMRDWINQGAAWPEGIVIVSAAKKTEAPTEVTPTEPQLAAYKPTAVELKAIKELEALGVAIRPIAVNLDWREANLRGQSAEAVAKALGPLGKVLGLVDLNLGGVQIKDADVANLKGLTNLNRLHLENTPVTDTGLVHLKGLLHLEYLNLYGTTVTDAGLEQLQGLTQLKRLYLWQTKTTEAGVANLKKTLPNVDISTGAEFKPIPTPEEKK